MTSPTALGNGDLPASTVAVAYRPPAMLVTPLASGMFLVQGYPSGATAYVRAEDAGPLRAALAAASGYAGPDSAYSQIAAPPLVRPLGDLPWA